MSWAEVSIIFLVCHLVGDYIVQTDWQANHKFGGLGRDPTARRALVSHVLTYTLVFIPALIWIGDEQGIAVAVAAAILIALPHLVIDDGRVLYAYMGAVKGTPNPPPVRLAAMVDQSFHVVSLWVLAVLVAA